MVVDSCAAVADRGKCGSCVYFSAGGDGKKEMNKFEVKVAKRRLPVCHDLLELAKEEDRKIMELQLYYEQLAGPKAIRYDREPGGRSEEKSGVYIQIFADQKDAEDRAKAYREEAAVIARFIDQVEDETARILMRHAYIEGMRYQKVGDLYGYSITGVSSRIERGLLAVDRQTAQAYGLL